MPKLSELLVYFSSSVLLAILLQNNTPIKQIANIHDPLSLTEGKKLRYVGTVDGGKCSVSLSSFPLDHPFSQAKGTDNVIEFTTARYHNQPLVVQGPGAGPEVTAAGIFADILRLSAYLGSRI